MNGLQNDMNPHFIFTFSIRTQGSNFALENNGSIVLNNIKLEKSQFKVWILLLLINKSLYIIKKLK